MNGFRSLQRQEQIVELLAQQGPSAIQALASRLHVSAWTVRRDLAELEAQGIVRRFHGGVELAEAPQDDERRPNRAQAAALHQAKLAIGQATIRFLPSDQHVAIGAGSTTTEVAQALRGKGRRLTVVTNGLNIALELAAEPLMQIICTGGDVHGEYYTLTGPATERALKAHFYDVAVIGVSGIAQPAGLTVRSRLNAAALQVMIEHARKLIVVADHSKFDVVCFAHLAPLSAVDVLITDAAPPSPLQAHLLTAHVDIVVAT